MKRYKIYQINKRKQKSQWSQDTFFKRSTKRKPKYTNVYILSEREDIPADNRN